jgi:hypothetical protein
MAMNGCNIQGGSSLHTTDVSKAIHMRLMHYNPPLEVVEFTIMIFPMLLIVKCKNMWVVTSIDGNE